MSNVVQLFTVTAISRPKKLEVHACSPVGKTKPKRSREIDLIAEAGRFAQAIKILSTIRNERSDIFENLTYRNEMELTTNMEKAVGLLIRFAKEMNLHVGEKDNRTSEFA
jgi:hypothetical protein